MGRVLSWSDPEIIRLLQEQFIPVTHDDWYQRRRQDEDGRFFRSVVDQTWKGGDWDDSGGPTRQGVYCFTPAGRMLTEMKNVSRDPAAVRDILARALRAWNDLPADQKKRGAFPSANPERDPNHTRPVPSGALVLRQYSRPLKLDGGRKYVAEPLKFEDTLVGPQHERAWILKSEWKALVPQNPKRGEAVAIPASLKNRLLRFHLVGALLGEPGHWEREHIRSEALKLTVESVSEADLRLVLAGPVLLSTEPDVKSARCGFDGAVTGVLSYDRKKQVFDRFDVVVVAETWGSLNTLAPERHPGRSVIGSVFELGGDKPTDQVPPHWARVPQEYLEGAP